MKILKISGKNLASLASQFSVDFEQEPLKSSGLFAISGPTGAGKSTLLDALCLALYDATPRLLKVAGRGNALPDVGTETVAAQDTRTLLRRGAAEGYAEVDFVGNDGVAYRARWNVRRAYNKAAGGLQATTMSLHRRPELQPIGGTKTEVKLEIERRIGLSFDQFTRAVLLAQNEFSTFLKTEDNERGELLETLTGSTIYSELSMRAFERAKAEQRELQRLGERLADRKPLGAGPRAALDAEAAQADAALAALELRRGGLERQLRWHQEAHKLSLSEQQAQQALIARQAEVAAAAPQRAALAQLEAARAARPLDDEIRRIDADFAQTLAAQRANAERAARAAAAAQAAALALQQAETALTQAEASQRDAAPALDRAKALDARIDGLLPSHQQAARAAQQACRAQESADAALHARRQQRASVDAAQQAGAAWLDKHRQWAALAQSWPRWDLLFQQAGQAAAQQDAANAALADAQRALDARRAEEEGVKKRLAASSGALASLEARRQEAIARLAGGEADALTARRQALDARRGQLQQADKIWTELAANRRRRAELDAQARQLRAAKERADAALALAQGQAERLMAGFAQAERSLTVAQAACADNVEHLRAALEDDSPCPVCGALEHPYRDDNGAMKAMLHGLQAEVDRIRRQAQDNLAHQATQRAQAGHSITQLKTVEAEQRALADAATRSAPLWTVATERLSLPSSPHQDRGEDKIGDADGDTDQIATWLAGQLASIQSELQGIEQQAAAIRRAQTARDHAQAACDKAAAEHAALVAAAAAAQIGLTQAAADHARLSERRIDTALQLGALLDELDVAFQQGDSADDGWKDHWHAGPARFHAQRQADSKQWLAQRAAQDERAQALGALDVELDAAGAALARTELDAAAARDALAVLEAQLSAMRAARQTLWQGRPVADVEAALAARIAQAKTQRQTRQSEREQAAQARARLDEAQAQAGARLAALRDDAGAAAARLDDWLTRQRAAPPELGIADAAQLRALLAVAADELEARRRALQALDGQAAGAATVLGERQHQRAQHQLGAPDDLDASAERLGETLAALAAEREAAHEAAGALRLALAQDEERRQQSRAMLADLERQEEVERRWARLNDLIGSADGKKFRNYAQQFTLEVLLGYANAHLLQLARRYRLERIANLTNPSLGLMVRDQDMGGELRSVHSLSGGESFLVSLALALGLASLSSNRVRVESLFIDEGFGSLDAETLRVAMDALDGLQSMGRKVGVISHVQEMTERIATKILVQPAAGGKSAVSVH